MKGTATGIYSIIVKFTAFLTALHAYGFIKGLIGKDYIMFALMIYGLFGCAEIFIADIYVRAKKIKLYKEEFINKKSVIETELDNIMR